MSTMVIKVIELIGISKKNFEDAVTSAVERASKSINNITGADVVGQSVKVKDAKVMEFRVNLKVAFIVNEK